MAFRPAALFPPVLSALAAVLWIGCSSTEQIEALPPAPGIVALPDTLDASLARVSISLRTEGELPEDVERLRLRANEVRLHAHEGGWRTLPASSGILQLSGDTQRVERNVLTTRIPAGSYDSLEVVFDELQLDFGPNVGSRLTSSRPPSTRRAMSLTVERSETVEMRLTLNLAASLARDASCRWYFLPFVSLELP